jgi:hypothetical protein
MGTGVPIQMGRLTDGALGESSNPNLTMEFVEEYFDKPLYWGSISWNPIISIAIIEKYPDNFDGPILRYVHPGLAHLGHMYRGSCGRLERMEMEAEWDDNQRRLEKLTELGYLEYTLGPQCGVCAGRE